MDFIEAIGTWIDESTLRRVQKASYISIMADECVNISTIEELSVFVAGKKMVNKLSLFWILCL